MTDKESYVNVAALKRKLRAWLKYRQASDNTSEELLAVVERLPKTLTADLESTLIGSDIDSVIKVLSENYEKALKMDYIKNKLAWALYQTWKKYDNRR